MRSVMPTIQTQSRRSGFGGKRSGHLEKIISGIGGFIAIALIGYCCRLSLVFTLLWLSACSNDQRLKQILKMDPEELCRKQSECK